ncbi:MAG TPA: twin-arginine translocase TatA/TatE family subunit [Solirubrobacteraceae bacterium]|jgi:TatA/E family protein of Tat protein translocase|nr:twin-arginine translocase TatA/TatE family subunit [Solirubrobacteraceae bacterium]
MDSIFTPVHLLFVAVVALIVLGPKRLPEMARMLGNGIRELREGLSSTVNPESAPGVHEIAETVGGSIREIHQSFTGSLNPLAPSARATPAVPVATPAPAAVPSPLPVEPTSAMTAPASAAVALPTPAAPPPPLPVEPAA